MTSNQRIDSYSVNLPNLWRRLPLDPNDQQAAKAALVEELSHHDDWNKTMERRIDLSLAQLNAQLAKIKTVMAAAFCDIWPLDVEDPSDPSQPNAEVVMATCTLGTLTKEDLGTEFPLTAGMLLGGVSMRSPKGVRPRPEDGIDLEPPVIVELKVGRAVRVRRHYEMNVNLGQRLGAFSESYLIPHDETGERICVLGFSTTNEDLATEFAPLFEKVAGTLRFFRPSDDTLETLSR